LLSVFITLLAMVRERQGDLALLRLMGAPARRLAALVAWQALLLVGLSVALGLSLAHAGLAGLAHWLASQQGFPLAAGYGSLHELALLPLGLLVALVAAAWPAWQALRADVTQLLQTPH